MTHLRQKRLVGGALVGWNGAGVPSLRPACRHALTRAAALDVTCQTTKTCSVWVLCKDILRTTLPGKATRLFLRGKSCAMKIAYIIRADRAGLMSAPWHAICVWSSPPPETFKVTSLLYSVCCQWWHVEWKGTHVTLVFVACCKCKNVFMHVFF